MVLPFDVVGYTAKCRTDIRDGCSNIGAEMKNELAMILPFRLYIPKKCMLIVNLD